MNPHGGYDAGRQGESPGAQRDAIWGVASQIVAGLLANPGRGHCSVKDSISLFDEVLAELSAYARVRGTFVEYLGDAPELVGDQGTGEFAAVPVRRSAPLPGERAPAVEQQHGPAQPAPGPRQPAPYGYGELPWPGSQQTG